MCLLGCRRLYDNLLETTLKSTVLLYCLGILVKGGCANTLYLTASQCRLEHIGCIHSATTATCTYDSVYLVDEDNDIRIFL